MPIITGRAFARSPAVIRVIACIQRPSACSILMKRVHGDRYREKIKLLTKTCDLGDMLWLHISFIFAKTNMDDARRVAWGFLLSLADHNPDVVLGAVQGRE